ncbi:MAG TPA: segregation/condensation protein A [Phycisphaerae bacterium]|nr:segregation/condensation protein A [Phycisphaerae bacterium]
MQDYRVQLDIYQGPLDLLLYLIRRDEVDIYDIPIARITEQFVQYVDLLKEIDPNTVGDFLVMAATLLEIKSRMLLPKPPPEEGAEDLADPRLDLVRQLLEYKKYKDAAARLAEAAEERAMRYTRSPATRAAEGVEVELDELQIWDLLTAFNNLMSAIGRPPARHEVVYDDTPISLHAADIQDRLEREGGSLQFERIFEGRSKSEMIGLFLALLELIRQKRVRAEQDRPFGTIFVHLLDATPITEASLAGLADEADRPDAAEEFEEESAGPGEPVFAAREAEEEEERDDEFARLLDQVNADVSVETELPPPPSETQAANNESREDAG